MRSSPMNWMLCSATGTRSRFTRTHYFVFGTEKFWGIKAAGVRSEWYSGGKRSHYRFGFASGQSA
jgi:hypothetical protein